MLGIPGMFASGCAHTFPNSVASRTPSQDAAGSGEAQRKSSTGGAAYGTPSQERTPLSPAPWSEPRSVSTRVGAAGTALAAVVPYAMEAAATPTAARLAAMVLAVLEKAIGGLAFGWGGTGFVRVWQNRTKDLGKRARRSR